MNKDTILIYSQHSLLTALLEAIIGVETYRIICCNTLTHTIQQCQSENPSLVILLDSSPFMSGKHLIESIRRNKSHHPAIYVISWQQSENTVLSLLECGIDQYLTFPISRVRLRLKASAHINQR